MAELSRLRTASYRFEGRTGDRRGRASWLAGRLDEEASKFRRYSAGQAAVVGRGVPYPAEYDLPGARQYVAEPIERGP